MTPAEPQEQASTAGKGLAGKTVRSSAWLYARNIVTSLFNLGVMAILARTLRPADFGLVALAQVLLRFIMVAADAGVADYVVYDRAEGRERRVHAAFWLNFVFTVASCALALGLIPAMTAFYHEPGLPIVLAACVARFAIAQMGVVPESLLKRSLEFGKLVRIDTVVELASSAISAALALTGFGIWALLLPALVTAPVRLVAVFRAARWLPGLRFYLEEWRRIVRYSLNDIGANLASAVGAETDTLLIGKLLGIEVLGIYNLAWQAANLVNRGVTSVVGKLAMPALSAVAEQPARLGAAYHRMIRSLAIVSFPLLIGLMVVADTFILTVYGPKWSAAVLPLRILIVYALRHTIGSPAGVIPNVVGRPEVGLRFYLALIPCHILILWIGGLWGMVGVAAAMTISRTLAGIVAFWIAAALIGQPRWEWLAVTIRPLLAACLMGLLLFGLRSSFPWLQAPGLPALLAQVAIGGALFGVLLLTLYRDLLGDLLAIVDSFSHEVAGRLRRLVRLPTPTY